MENMGRILITDIDDVLLDWTKSFDQFIREEYDYNGVYLGDNTQRLWEVLCIKKGEIFNIMKSHSELQRFNNLEYYKDSIELLDNFDNFDNIFAITSCGNTIDIIKKRKYNLNKRFPGIIDKVFFLNFLEKKKKILKEIKNKYPTYEIYMIDDNVNDIQSAISLGINGYVYTTSFHKHFNLPVVNSLNEFFNNIKG